VKEEVMEELPAMMQRRTRSDTGHSMDNFLYYSMIDPRAERAKPREAESEF
jgi:hypothetical protein